MRVSEQSRLAARMSYLSTATERLDALQQQLSTGRRIQRASDDPAGSALALRHREEIAYEEQMRRNLSSGVSFMNATEAALDGATDTLQRIRELTVQAANGTLGSGERSAVSAEVDQLIGQLAQLANTNFGGAYIFSGHQANTPAYQVNGNPPTSISYQGDDGLRVRRISKEDSAPINVPGSEAFGTIFDDLIALRNNLNSSVPPSVIGDSLQAIDAGLQRVLDARSKIGARVNRFETAQRLSERTDTDLQQLQAEIEQVDLTDTIVQFQAQQNAFEAALGAIGRTANMTLLDFLR
ncbi:MAG: flagellar hook-associated protein FlgL [Hyphomicrobiales bacterium]